MSHATSIESGRPASRAEHEVTALVDLRVRVRDGLDLSINLWLPAPRRAGERFPAILEMHPYGKDGARATIDHARMTWLAERGFAACRLDVRGTGSSPGIAGDEYAQAETEDGYDVVEWLAAQPWCNGNVGMWGISYSGFTAIQVAAMRPPHLKAIVPIYATDDRYRDDVHYLGGCLGIGESMEYAMGQIALNASPPRPEHRGSTWFSDWLERLEQTPPWLMEWLRDQVDGPRWRQGSLAPDYGRITAAILHIGGWMDSYVDPVLRMQEHCVNAPRRSIVGNWVHALPDSAAPGPNIDWLHELVRFFDHWLKEDANGTMDEPAFTWFQREYTEPESFPAALNGGWRSVRTFPPKAVSMRELSMRGGTVPWAGKLQWVTEPPSERPVDGGVDRYRHRPEAGIGIPFGWGASGMTRDLRPEEALGPVYTSPPLDEALDILGFPEAVLHLSASSTVATAVVRLADVAPDGTSAQVSAGILNLTHRDGHEQPTGMEPGRVYEVTIPLRAAGYRFRPGHRIRVSVASSFWPVIWPSPFPTDFELHWGDPARSRLRLPVLPASPSEDAPAIQFKTTSAGVPVLGTRTSGPPSWRVIDDVAIGEASVHVQGTHGMATPDARRSFNATRDLQMTVHRDDPAAARVRHVTAHRWVDHGVETNIRATCSVWSTASDFHVALSLDVTLDDTPIFTRSWLESLPRQWV